MTVRPKTKFGLDVADLQGRLALPTASAETLDEVAHNVFNVTRDAGETDEAFRERIRRLFSSESLLMQGSDPAPKYRPYAVGIDYATGVAASAFITVAHPPEDPHKLAERTKAKLEALRERLAVEGDARDAEQRDQDGEGGEDDDDPAERLRGDDDAEEDD